MHSILSVLFIGYSLVLHFVFRFSISFLCGPAKFIHMKVRYSLVSIGLCTKFSSFFSPCMCSFFFSAPLPSTYPQQTGNVYPSPSLALPLTVTSIKRFDVLLILRWLMFICIFIAQNTHHFPRDPSPPVSTLHPLPPAVLTFIRN